MDAELDLGIELYFWPGRTKIYKRSILLVAKKTKDRKIPQSVFGTRLRLRLVVQSDAEYIYALRTNRAYNRYISEIRGTERDQALWIENYKERELENREAYYVVERMHDAVRCGVIRLYNIEPGHFRWGSWILDHNKTAKAALECAVLSFGVGFYNLGCDYANVEVRVDNLHADAFYRRLGMHEVSRNNGEVHYVYQSSKYEADRQSFLKILALESLE